MIVGRACAQGLVIAVSGSLAAIAMGADTISGSGAHGAGSASE